MKKLLLAALITISAISSSFAKDVNNVNHQVRNSFFNHFGVVKDVQWKTTASYNVATFTENNKAVQAFYNHKGELIGTSRNIQLEELTTKAKRTVATKYADYVITQAIKFENNDEVAYFLSANKAGEELVLKVVGGSVSVFKSK